MSFACVHSRAVNGVDAPLVTIEVHITNGLAGVSIVGLPEAAVRESRDRVRSAIMNSGLEFPSRRITINLAPADLPKEGSRFDLAIAMGILAASGQLPAASLSNIECIGELSLSGDLHSVRGILPAALAARDAGKQLIIAPKNGHEASLIDDITAFSAPSLLATISHLRGETLLTEAHQDDASTTSHHPANLPDLADVKGQHQAKRALEIAAAGRHNMLMSGPPGSGKSMLAQRLASILPILSEAEAIDSAAIYSVSSQGFEVENWRRPPFRSPHHTASAVALVGGGSNPKPGEISLAHNGILFLDELTEFDRRVLEVLREPLETGYIDISRAANQARYPASFQLIAAMNPPEHGGRANKLSAPLLDRIDLHIDVPRTPNDIILLDGQAEESSNTVRTRVIAARNTAYQRQGKTNALLSAKETDHFAALETPAMQLLQKALSNLNLSTRAYHRIIRLALTIADLDGSDHITAKHMGEAISLRQKQ